MNIANLLTNYKDLKTKQRLIPSSLNEWDYNEKWYPIEHDLAEVFSELASKDVPTAREVILDSIRTFRYPRGLEKQPLFDLLNRVVRSSKSNENNILEVFCDKDILTELSNKQGFLILCKNTSNAYYEEYRVDYSSYGLLYLLVYCINNDNHEIAAVILSLIAIDDIPTVLVDVFSEIKEKNGFDNKALTFNLIEGYIARSTTNYRKYLNLLVSTKLHRDTDFSSCMDVIDSISIAEDYSWFIAACELVAKAYPNKIHEIVLFILNKNSELLSESKYSSQLCFVVIRMLRSVDLYAFVQSSYSIIDRVFGNLNVYINGFGMTLYLFQAAIAHNDAVLLDKLFLTLSINPFVHTFEDLYENLLTNKPELSSQLIEVFIKWKAPNSKKSESIMSRYEDGDILQSFSNFLDNSDFNDDSLYLGIIKWNEKAANDNISNIPKMVVLLFNKIRQIEYELNNQTLNMETESDSDMTWQLSHLLPMFKQAGAILFLKAFLFMDVTFIEDYLKLNRTAYDFVKEILINNTDWAADVAQVFGDMFWKKEKLHDSQVLAIANLLFFKASVDTYAGFVEQIMQKEGNAWRNEALLNIVNMWQSEKINLETINSIRNQLFLQQVALKTISFNRFANTEGFIAAGGNDVLFHTINAIASDNLDLASQLLNELFRRMDKAYSLASIAFRAISLNNYINLMLVNERLFRSTCDDQKIYNTICRKLLGAQRFNEFADIIHRSVEIGYTEVEICNRLYGSTLLKKDVEPIDSQQIEFLALIAAKFSPSSERKKLENRLTKLK